jgi:hypothetical protein
MEAQQTTYTYTPLDEARREIRLLHVFPKPNHREDTINTVNDNTIYCSFSIVSLDNPPEFEALSYAWGDPKQVVSIWLEGHKIQVTMNLHCALDNLRFTEEEGLRVLWADALCINQGDQHERQSQVEQMQHIYSKALKVIAFLGEAWEGSEVVMKYHKYLAKIGSNEQLQHRLSGVGRHSSRGLDGEPDSLGTYVAKFFSLPWFKRTWTVQEYFLARNVVFQCGQHTQPAHLFRDAVKIIENHSGKFRNADIEFMRSLMAYQALWESYRGSSTNNSFMKMLISLRTRQSYDPRDKVYGILSLADTSFRDGLAPDYGLSVSEVYTKVAANMIAINGNLDILSCVIPNPRNEFGLPSFVPNWSTKMPWRYTIQNLLRWGTISNGHFDTSRGAEPRIAFAENRVATCQMLVVDKLARIYASTTSESAEKAISGSSSNGIDFDLEYMDDYYDIEDIYTSCTPYRSKLSAYWRVMCGNLFQNGLAFDMDSFRIAETTDFSRFMKWQTTRTKRDAIGETHDDEMFHKAHAIVSHGRLFFTTEKGYMGWAPKGARKSDVVVIMPGGKVPYVLRSLDNDDEDGYNDANEALSGGTKHAPSAKQHTLPRYRFLGDAYVQGIMNGEAFDESKLESITLV